MDVAQITGAASSYARKYALNGLFCIDDTKDADSQEPAAPVKKEKTKAQVMYAEISKEMKSITTAEYLQDYFRDKAKDIATLPEKGQKGLEGIYTEMKANLEAI